MNITRKCATQLNLLPTKTKRAFTLAEGATHVDLPPTIAKFGFTLAEVLITLGIIGVVAAITIPNMIANNKAKKLRTQFLKSYSVISQSIKLMQNDDISLDPNTYSSQNSFYTTYKKYFHVAIECSVTSKNNNKGSSPLCYSKGDSEYKALDGKSTPPYSRFDDGQFILQDGMLVMLDNPFNNASNVNLWVSVDINGKTNGPNRLGVDVFTFVMGDNESLLPMGANGTPITNLDNYCNPKYVNAQSGMTCAQKAMSDSDYFKKILKEIK